MGTSERVYRTIGTATPGRTLIVLSNVNARISWSLLEITSRGRLQLQVRELSFQQHSSVVTEAQDGTCFYSA